MLKLSAAEVRDVALEGRRKYPRAFSQAHSGGPESADFIVLVARDLQNANVAKGGSATAIGCNYRRAVVGDISWDGLSVQYPEDQRYYFADIIVGAGGPNPSIEYNAHPFRDSALLRDSSGQYAPHGYADPRQLRVVGPEGSGTPTGPTCPDPSRHSKPDCPKPSDHIKPPYVGDHAALPFGELYKADVERAGQTLNAGSYIWPFRVFYDHYVGGMTLEEAIKKQREGPDGWLRALGLQ